MGLTLARLSARDESIDKDLARIIVALEKNDDLLVEHAIRISILESKMTDMKAVVDEADRRRWAVRLAVAGSILTMVVNIALLGVRK